MNIARKSPTYTLTYTLLVSDDCISSSNENTAMTKNDVHPNVHLVTTVITDMLYERSKEQKVYVVYIIPPLNVCAKRFIYAYTHMYKYYARVWVRSKVKTYTHVHHPSRNCLRGKTLSVVYIAISRTPRFSAKWVVTTFDKRHYDTVYIGITMYTLAICTRGHSHDKN